MADSQKPLSSFERLSQRSFGGSDVAARPGAIDDDWWPIAPLLPGVEALIDEFTAQLLSGADLTLAFLLGGAGNGKSFAARKLAKLLGLPAASHDALAQRKYDVPFGAAVVHLLNDATIAPRAEYSDNQRSALATDLEAWLEATVVQRHAAFCCVNRGIVIDELRAAQPATEFSGTFALAVLRWLADPTLSPEKELSAEAIGAEAIGKTAWRSASFRHRGRTIRLFALPVDTYSLMKKSGASGQSRAESVFRQVVERCYADAKGRDTLCPVRANVEQWSSSAATTRWTGLLDAAEVSSGRLHSYRDVWGLAALSILGPRVAEAGAGIGIGHIDRLIATLNQNSSPQERIGPLLALSRYRAPTALFHAPVPTGAGYDPLYPPDTPTIIGLASVDPSLWQAKHAMLVEEALQSIALGDPPSKYAGLPSLLDGFWTSFDDELERGIIASVASSDCPDSARRKLSAWFGGYMQRLVGLASGEFGNKGVVDAWHNYEGLCMNGVAPLPIILERSVRALLFPTSGHATVSSTEMLVPAFAVRVAPLAQDRDGLRPRLAELVSHSQISLRLRRKEARVFVECQLAGHEAVVGQLALDFALLREAFACTDGVPGQTESTVYIEPRIERCRASSVRAAQHSNRRLVAVSNGRYVEVSQ